MGLLAHLRSFDRTTELVVLTSPRSVKDMAADKAKFDIYTFLQTPIVGRGLALADVDDAPAFAASIRSYKISDDAFGSLASILSMDQAFKEILSDVDVVVANMSYDGTPSPAGSPNQTIEGVVRELLKPMLKDWLDHHLPAIVESRVEAELERIARMAR